MITIKIARAYLFLLVFFCCQVICIALADAKLVAPVVLGFDGERNIGRNTSSTLYMQLWSTMRKAPWPNPNKIFFEDSITLWDSEPVTPYSHAEAEERAVLRRADLALWGRSHPYGGGILIEAKITIPNYSDIPESNGQARHESWTVRFNGDNMTVAFPKRRIDWANVTLSEPEISELSQPFGMPIFREIDSNDIVGIMSPWVVAREFRDGAALVEDGGKRGWIRYPRIGKAGRATVVLFAGGVVRLMRGDYQGAELFFNEILERQTEINITNALDTHVLRGLTAELQGKSGLSDFEFAFKQNPFSPPYVEHYIAGILSENNPASKEAKITILRKVMEDYGVFLDKTSDFYDLDDKL